MSSRSARGNTCHDGVRERAPLRAGRSGRASRPLPCASCGTGMARADRGGGGRGSLDARAGARDRPRARRVAAGGGCALARPQPRDRAHGGRARRERGTRPARHLRTREPEDARAHRQGAGKRRDATRRRARRVEPRAPGGDHPADGRPGRRGGRRGPCLGHPARRPGGAGRTPPPARRAVELRRDRDARARTRGRRRPGDRPLHLRGRSRLARLVARRRPAPGMARGRSADLGLDPRRRYVLRPLLELGRADARDAAAAPAPPRPRGQPALGRSVARPPSRAPACDRAALRRLPPGALHRAPARAPRLPRGHRRRVRRTAATSG